MMYLMYGSAGALDPPTSETPPVPISDFSATVLFNVTLLFTAFSTNCTPLPAHNPRMEREGPTPCATNPTESMGPAWMRVTFHTVRDNS